MYLMIDGLQIPECRKLRQFITDYYPHLSQKVGGSLQNQLNLENAAFSNNIMKSEKPLHTYYCLFLPLGIYCAFGAENIHHAYNKAAKHWGKKNPISQDAAIAPKGEYTREHRISVFDCLKHVNIPIYREVSHTLMTKLVKAWREENN